LILQNQHLFNIGQFYLKKHHGSHVGFSKKSTPTHYTIAVEMNAETVATEDADEE